MRDIISVNIGNAGTKIGLDFWELLCLEGNLDSSGKLKTLQYDLKPGYTAFFNEVSSTTYTPRALFIDTDPDISYITNTRQLYQPQYTISGTKSLYGNYGKGISSKYYNNENISLIKASLDRIRNLAEKTDKMEGFIITHSVSGGTGSSLTSMLLEKITEEYTKKIRSTISLMPSENNDEILEPYNVMNCMYGLIENSDLTYTFENDALKDICKDIIGIENPNFENYNHLIAHAMSSITCSLRNSGSYSESLFDYVINHVAYPPAHFLLTSQFPLWSSEKSCPPNYNSSELTFEVFDPIYFMTKCNLNLGKYMSVSLLYRGDCVLNDISCAIRSIKVKRKMQFVDWCPRGIKYRIDYEIPKLFPNSDISRMIKYVFLCCNSSATSEVFQRILSRFDLSYANREYLDKLYQEGIDDEMLIENRERIKCMIDDFEEIVKEVEADESEI